MTNQSDIKIFYWFFSLFIIIGCKTPIPLSVSTKTYEWKQISSNNGSIPHKRHEAAFVKVKDKFYLLGGRRIQPSDIYDPKKNSWRHAAAPPIEMHHFQPVVYQNEIWIAGAMTGPYPGEAPIDHMYIYNPEEDRWRKGPIIPQERRRGGAGTVIVGDHLYLFCGIIDGHRSGHVPWLDRFNFKTQQWEVLPDAPRPRDHFQAIALDGKVYVGGGRTTIAKDNPFKHTIGPIDMYDIAQNLWKAHITELPTPRAGNMVVSFRGELIYIGGESFTQESAHAEVEAYNPVTDTWSIWPELPWPRHGTGIVIYHNKLYLASGCGNRGGEPELEDIISLVPKR